MNVYNCKSCNRPHHSVLDTPGLIICQQCHDIVFYNEYFNLANLVAGPVPDDWSFVKIGTQFQYNQHLLTIIGRIRYQLRNDYKNLWCASLPNRTHIWIMESFASFCILGSSPQPFSQDMEKLRAGELITLKGGLNLRGEYVEKCEAVSYEGELAPLKFIQAGFFFMQFSNNKNETAVFFVMPGMKIEYLAGGKIDIDKLDLKNIITWDEWK